MSFFEKIPDHVAPAQESSPAPIERNADEGVFPNELGVPVSIPMALLVAERHAVAADSFRVHRDGLYLHMRIVSRNPTTDHSNQLFGSVVGDGTHQAAQLRWGIEFSDGRRAVAGDISKDGFHIRVSGASGSSGLMEMDAWVNAIPSPGPMRFHLSWPEGGIAETSFAMPTGDIISASETATQLWPD